MKTTLLVFALLAATQLFAADKTLVTVKDSSVNNGVVLVNVKVEGKSLELQCTQSAPFCKTVQTGSYWMVHLPENHGLYDCDNVDLFAQSDDPETAQKVGEFCLNTK
jgi:hypothetical protein